MPIQDLKAQIARLPEQPGVYLYSNGAGETLYVGKARALRDRVRSYLGAQGMSPRIDALLEEARHLEVIVTDSVVEALALENHLITCSSRPAKRFPASSSRGGSRRTITTTPDRFCPRRSRARPWRSRTGCSGCGPATR